MIHQGLVKNLQKHVKGRGHCFSIQVVMNKCFLLNLKKKIGSDPS